MGAYLVVNVGLSAKPRFSAGRRKPVKEGRLPAVNEAMSIRLAASAYIGLAVYCLISLIMGPMGVLAYEDLDARVRGMRENLTLLEALNSEARARKDSAHSDPEALALEARSLGYVGPDQVVVRLGFPEASSAARDLGTLVPFTQPGGMRDEQVKAISLAAALCAAFAGFLVRPGRKTPRGSRRGERGVTFGGTGSETGT